MLEIKGFKIGFVGQTTEDNGLFCNAVKKQQLAIWKYVLATFALIRSNQISFFWDITPL